MPTLQRPGQPKLHYALDDFTDPWKNAPCLVLQHGYGRSGKFWTSWVPYLSRYYRVVRPDLRGLGAPVHYCGESLGGILGMVLAAEHPEKLRSLSHVAAPVLINKDTQRTFAFGHATWQDALRTMGSRGWAEAANYATPLYARHEPGALCC